MFKRTVVFVFILFTFLRLLYVLIVKKLKIIKFAIQ